MEKPNRYENLARQVSAIGAVKRGMARALPVDCPSGSAVVLALLNHHGGMRMSRVSELMAVDMSVSSRHVANTVEHGWVERLPDPEDKRSRILRLTPAGHDMLAELDRRVTETLARNLADWSDEDVDLLTALLARLRGSFGDCRAHHA
ncbi:MarR family transcriptional regulator [Streptomyces sp. NPDC006551]|uniref:MarR family winged helix-turn-helix transcriptional regulator n=1 Tax=Streptomyces sp. NPDC006551 TaxID=3157178 RepID=UPI0033B23EFD